MLQGVLSSFRPSSIHPKTGLAGLSNTKTILEKGFWSVPFSALVRMKRALLAVRSDEHALCALLR